MNVKRRAWQMERLVVVTPVVADATTTCRAAGLPVGVVRQPGSPSLNPIQNATARDVRVAWRVYDALCDCLKIANTVPHVPSSMLPLAKKCPD